MKSFKIGHYIIPAWLIAVLLVSIVCSGAVGYLFWTTLNIPVEVKEPIEIKQYPSQLSLYAGETLDFNVTVYNHASINYSVILNFHLSNTTYQENYVTFSNENYTVVPNQQNLTAWVEVGASAPPINVTLAIDFRRGVGSESQLFYDDFNDNVADGWTQNLGPWSVVNGEYSVSVGIVENGISTVDSLNLNDCVVETQLRFTDSVGFRAGIVFRYVDDQNYYSFELSNEYDKIEINKYSSQNPDYGTNISTSLLYPIDVNMNYMLRIEIHGSTFVGYLNNQQMVTATDNDYAGGKVGLRARRADAFFDDFNVTRIP